MDTLDTSRPLPAGNLAFLSWLREGLGGWMLAQNAAAAEAGRMRLTVRLRLAAGATAADSTAATVEGVPAMRLHGPADVAAIDPRQILRTVPVAEAADFEPSLFPHIEFDRPDLPWLFAPAPPDAAGHWPPWITLIVVPTAAATLRPATDTTRPLPTVECPLAALPPLAEAWAWAHAQVVQGGTAGPLDAALRRDTATLSRLVAARRLDPNTRYLACVVPTYRLGCRAGLGETIAAADLQAQAQDPAWPAPGSQGAPETVTLPVYFQWNFTTGQGGDFASLARAMRPRQLPPTVGTLTIDVSAPGWTTPPAADHPLPLPGLLQPLPVSATAWEATSAFRQQLVKVLNSEAQMPGATGATPLLGPPLYGQAYPQLDRIDEATAPPWLTDANLRVENRIAAGLGALAVRFEQESLMAAAWEQLPALFVGGQQAHQQLAETVTAGMTRAGRPTPMAAALAALLPETAAPPSATLRRLTRNAGAETSAPHVRAQLDQALAMTPERTPPGPAAPADTMATAIGAIAAAVDTAAAPPTFTPDFVTPVSGLLYDYFPEFFLPGTGDIHANTIALLGVNAGFVEAFMLGLNHEMGRELRWRGYPADPRGTVFRNFWDRHAWGDGAPDLPPVAEWGAATRLGTHLRQDGTPTLLLLRGDLLKRFPGAAVYAEQAVWKDGLPARGGPQRAPLFLMSLPPDIVLVAFDIPPADIPGAAAPGGAAGWFFVLQELPGAPRFGLEAAGMAFGGQPATWRALSWSHVAADAAALQALRWLPLAGARADHAVPAATADASAAWASSAADMALITRRLPFQIAVHGRVWFDTTATPNP